MLPELSEKEARVVAYVEQELREFRVPSSYEMALAAGLTSKGYRISSILGSLEDKGYLSRNPGRRRSVRLHVTVDGRPFNPSTVQIPIVGCIAAGEPIPVPSSDYHPYSGDMIELAKDMLGGHKDVFALKVKGDSMIDALVGDGDIVIMKQQPTVQEGEMAAIWLRKDEETTLKYFHLEGEEVRLDPANQAMKPFFYPASEVEVQGKVLAVIRQLA